MLSLKRLSVKVLHQMHNEEWWERCDVIKTSQCCNVSFDIMISSHNVALLFIVKLMYCYLHIGISVSAMTPEYFYIYIWGI